MRSRAPIFAVLFVLGLFALPHFAQASVPFFGPIIPNGGNEGVCPAGFGMLIQVINNIISFSITIAIVFVAPIMTAYSGFLMVVNQGNAENLSKAKGYLINTVIGIVVALCGWMLVDAIMAALYASPSGWSSTWSELISGDASRCLDQAGTQPGTGLNQVTASGLGTTPGATDATRYEENNQLIAFRDAPTISAGGTDTAPTTGSPGGDLCTQYGLTTNTELPHVGNTSKTLPIKTTQGYSISFTTGNMGEIAQLRNDYASVAQYVTVSKNKCDYAATLAPLCAKQSATPVIYYKVGGTSTYQCILEPNTTYYLNVRDAARSGTTNTAADFTNTCAGSCSFMTF